VVQQNKVDRTLVKRALLALRKVTPNVIGAVLNAVDVKTKGYYGYGDYGARRDAKDKKNPRGAPSSRPSAAVPQPEATDVPLV
jgi:Mrp family chromosome partitioning ATPase